MANGNCWRSIPWRGPVRLVCLTAALVAAPAVARAELSLTIQPILSEANTRAAYQPLADYLSAVTGEPVRLRTMPNFLSYWSLVSRGEKQALFFDAAHFTAYRSSRFGYHALVKIPDTVSYSLIVRQDRLVFDPTELTARPVASLGTPSIGAARLNGMFPNPSRQPVVVEVADTGTAIQMVVDDKVAAAIVPTPVVSQHMAQGAPINVVTTTEPIPHIALSASPDIDHATRLKIQQALLSATNSPAGQKMLKAIGFERFDPVTPTTYAGHDRVLKEYWGY